MVSTVEFVMILFVVYFSFFLFFTYLNGEPLVVSTVEFADEFRLEQVLLIPIWSGGEKK
jgi:hypothetical protein